MLAANGVTFYYTGDTIIYEDYIETLKNLKWGMRVEPLRHWEA